MDTSHLITVAAYHFKGFDGAPRRQTDTSNSQCVHPQIFHRWLQAGSAAGRATPARHVTCISVDHQFVPWVDEAENIIRYDPSLLRGVVEPSNSRVSWQSQERGSMGLVQRSLYETLIDFHLCKELPYSFPGRCQTLAEEISLQVLGLKLSPYCVNGRRTWQSYRFFRSLFSFV